MRAGLFAGMRGGIAGTPTPGTERADGMVDAQRAPGPEKGAVAVPMARASHVVSPVVARMFRRAAAGRSAAGRSRAEIPTREVREATPATSGRPETTPRARAFESSRREIEGPPAAPSDRREDEFFRKRLAIQRASNIWAPLIVAWFDASATSRGAWSLPDLMAAIRAEAKTMAEAGLATGGNDERLVLSLTGLLAKAAACELRAASRDGRFLGRDSVKEASAALRGILEEPPARTLREPPSDGVRVRGGTSLAISTADIVARLLPSVGRHAGLATEEVLDTVLGEIRRRSGRLVAGILPDTATERDRQSLLQSMMRREAELMGSCLEQLPPAGAGSLIRGRAPLERAMECYRLWSDAMAREVEHAADHPHASVNSEAGPPCPT